MKQTITPFLWFDGKIDQAVKFYKSAFKDFKVLDIRRDGKQTLSATVRINGQDLILFNGGPYFKFTPAISFFIEVKTQKEVDTLWSKLSKGGEIQKCGWLQDKYGLSWQVVPEILGKLLNDKNEEKSERVWEAMMKMTKIDIAALKKAHSGK